MPKAEIVQYEQKLGYGLNDENRNLLPDRGKRFFSCSKLPDLLWIFTQSPIKGYRGLFDGQ
jgi:hypothetical protein